MEKNEFLKLIKKDRYQVFLFSSPLPLPVIFASHVWIVTEIKENEIIFTLFERVNNVWIKKKRIIIDKFVDVKVYDQEKIN